MRIRDFLADNDLVESWLAQQTSALSTQDIFMSYWRHSGSQGFGLVITDGEYSGEFHLMNDGTVTRHVEKRFDTLESGAAPVAHLHELEARFQDFKSKIVRRSAT